MHDGRRTHRGEMAKHSKTTKQTRTGETESRRENRREREPEEGARIPDRSV